MMKADYFTQHERERQKTGTPGRPLVEQPSQPMLRCANCDIEIAWMPTMSGNLAYCCLGCAQGGPCSCDYSEHSDIPPRE